MAGLIQNEDVKSESELTGAGGTKSQLINDDKIYVTGLGINKRLDEAIIQGDIGAGGGINHISNNEFSSDTTGYALYVDAAQDIPVDGTGDSGSANITFTRNTTSPLRGSGDGKISKPASNEIGEGVSYDVTADIADQTKIMEISFDYTTSANYADDDMSVFLYDVTNAALIRFNGEELKGSTGQAKYLAYVQLPYNSTSYRVIWHIASTNGTAYDVNIDNVKFGPAQCFNSGEEPVKVVYNTNTNSLALNASTPVEWTVKEIDNYGAWDGAGTFTAPREGLYSFEGLWRTTAAVSINIFSYVNGALRHKIESNPTVSLVHPVSGMVLLGKGDTFSIRTNASVTLSNAEGTSASISIFEVGSSGACGTINGAPLFEKYYGNSGQSITAGTTNITWETKEESTTGSFDGTTFTAPYNGNFAFNGWVRLGSSTTAQIYSYKNGSSHRRLYNTNAGERYYPISTVESLEKGDTITFRVLGYSGNISSSDSFSQNMTIWEVAVGSGIVAPQEKILVKYKGNAAGSLTADTTDIDFDTKVFDTHGAWNGTGFISPRTGYYRFIGMIRTGASYSNFFKAYIDGVYDAEIIGIGEGGQSHECRAMTFLEKGEEWSIRVSDNSSLQNVADIHWIAIESVD